jgi:hypothetical protein
MLGHIKQMSIILRSFDVEKKEYPFGLIVLDEKAAAALTVVAFEDSKY